MASETLTDASSARSAPSFRILEIPHPYLIMIGEAAERLDVKTGLGLVEWRPGWCAGQYRFHPRAADLGLPDMTPAQAAAAGAATMVFGGATFGGRISAEWEAAAMQALDAGLNVASGMHDKLNDRPELVRRAKAKGLDLFDVRALPPGFKPPVATGRPRSGKRLLTVGTDCAVGKKYTALALERDLRAAGELATFRATGQTGILISGGGVAVDAVVSDFLSGVVELLSPDNLDRHWDVIEGQGSLFHPAYSAVSLGLLHGSQPDVFVVCHDAAKPHLIGYPDYPTPSIEECIALHVACGRRVNPAIRCAGLSLNTSRLPQASRLSAIADLEDRTGLPCVDPMLTGTAKLVEALTQPSA